MIAMIAACGDDIDTSTDLGKSLDSRVPQPSRHQESDNPGYVGVLVPHGLSEVIAPFSSTVTELDVGLGDHVKHGQQLALLDDRPLREELAIAQAALKSNQAGVAQAEVERRTAIDTRDRERHAFEAGVSAQVTLSNAEFMLRKAETTVARAAAAVDEQRARIAQLTARIGDTRLLAPIDGRVALLYVRKGDRVDEGRAVIRVISSEELFVKFAIPAEMMGSLAPGDAVDVRIDQFSATVRGVVRKVAPEIDPIAKMILAEADLIAAPGWLQSGIVCRIIPRARNATK